MRRILFPLLIIGLATGLFTLGSGAFFSDTAEDTNNTITAGTMTLEVTQKFNAVASCTLPSNAKPGDPVSCSSTLTNTGSLAGKLYLAVEVVSPDSLAGQLDVTSGAATAGSGSETAAASTWVGGATWAALAMGCTHVSDLAGTETFTFSFTTTFNSGAGNEFQGKSATLNFYYLLLQAEHSGTPANTVAGCQSAPSA
jgi:predicted ribosomally synthesized peptide with SipW-like signal peptide